MMKACKYLLLVLGLTAGLAIPAVAQNANQQKAPKPVTPAANMVALPAFDTNNKPVMQNADFPPLPQSVACKQQDMLGLWKLQQVYETPSGTETAAFAATPVQYIFFEDNSVFGRFNPPAADMTPDAIRDEITKHATGLQQFLVQDNGFVFFYQDKVASDTQVCFIVATPKGSFVKGQMLIMPPKGQIRGRMVKVWNKIWPLPAAPAVAPKLPLPPPRNR